MLSRLIDSSVFGINGFDLGAYAAVPTLLAVIAAVACAVPAQKAARMDPVACLREE
jgi:ABC-type lipoprotein release transport system permease subunit